MDEKQKKEIVRLFQSLPEEKADAAIWVMRNIGTIDELLSEKGLTVARADDLAMDAAIRRDYHMLALILYSKFKYCDEEFIGSFLS